MSSFESVKSQQSAKSAINGNCPKKPSTTPLVLVQARAYALIGDAYLELNKYKEAADQYEKAANYKANEYFSPGYLMKEATARELAKDYDGAIRAYTKIVDEYQNAAEVTDAKQYLARAQAAAGK